MDIQQQHVMKMKIIYQDTEEYEGLWGLLY